MIIGLLENHHSVLSHLFLSLSTFKPGIFGCHVRCGRFFRIVNSVYCNGLLNSGYLVSNSLFYKDLVHVVLGSSKNISLKLGNGSCISMSYFFRFISLNSSYSCLFYLKEFIYSSYEDSNSQIDLGICSWVSVSDSNVRSVFRFYHCYSYIFLSPHLLA